MDETGRTRLFARLMAVFVEEFREHVATLAAGIEILSGGWDLTHAARHEHLVELLRAAHSLKGSARSLDLRLLERACHRLEEIFVAARDGELPLGPRALDQLRKAVEALDDAHAALRSGSPLEQRPVAKLVADLNQFEARAREENQTAPLPALDPSTPSMALSDSATVIPNAEASAAGAEVSRVSARALEREAYIRVPNERLSSVVAASGELLSSLWHMQAHAQDVVDAIPENDPARRRNGERLLEEIDRLRRSAQRVADEARSTRLVPFAECCEGFDRMVAELARTLGKDVRLVVEGTGAVDRSVSDALRDPLRHLLRNALDHGIEKPAERLAAGKPRVATLRLGAQMRGAHVEIVVSDDGRGIQREALRARLRASGGKQSVDTDDRALLASVFEPGFSTARAVTALSGRGMGLNVVKTSVESMHGFVELDSTEGEGTVFRLAVPLTLSTLRVLLVRSGGQCFGFASAYVESLLRVSSTDTELIGTWNGKPALLTPGTSPMPLMFLSEVLDMRAPARDKERDKCKGQLSIIRLKSSHGAHAFVVDSFDSEEELVVENLGSRLEGLALASGAAVLPDGDLAIVLNASELLRTARERPALGIGFTHEPARPVKKRLLVVDDSITTRSLEKSILETAGYQVATAIDGMDGWRVLQEMPVDLVVCDVDMPRMNGFALAEMVRASPRLKNLPFVLVTGRADKADRLRGLDSGASAYVAKGTFDQSELLETIAQLL